MQELDSLISQVETLRFTPYSAELRGVLLELRQLVAKKVQAASQTDAPEFRDIARMLSLLPDFAEPELQTELTLDVARYFYVSGLPFDAIEPLKRAEMLGHSSGLMNFAARAANMAGIIYADTGNSSRAIEKYSEAIEITQATGNKLVEASVWMNLGVALHYCAEYQTAMACVRHAAEMSSDDPALKAQKLASLNNVALISIHTGEFLRGLRAVNDALAEVDEPTNASQLFSRVLMERNAARLFLESHNVEAAKIHVEKAKHYAELSKSPRAELEASIAEGLYLVYAGNTDLGLTKLMGTLERARFLKSALRDVLVALVKAYEKLNQPDRALIYLREMMDSTKKFQQENILKHLKLDMKQLEADSEVGHDPKVELEQHEKILRGQMAEQELFKSRIEMLERLAVTAELRDDSTGEHSFRVGKLASLLAQDYGCDEDTIFMIDLAGRLHDIGKVGIPDAILLKPDKLNQAEFSIMRTHAAVGAELLSKSNIPHLQMAEEIARCHHEWWDGSGYPGGLSGNAIPLAARITALADVYDALTHKRPYKEAWPIDNALDEILSLKGKQFDPELTDMFLVLIARLRREFTELDTYLGQAAAQSPFLQARSKIWETLRRSKQDDSGAGSRLDVQR